MRTNSRKEKPTNWLKRQPFWGFYLCVLLLIILVMTVWGTLNTVDIKTIQAASTMLSTAAQVSSTLAGFLMVAMVFLIDGRRRWLGENWTLWDIFDIVLIALAIMVFVIVALGTTIDLGYVLSQSEVSSVVSGRVLRTVVLMECGTIATASGLGLMFGIEYGKYARHRKPAESTKEPNASNDESRNADGKTPPLA